MWMRDRPWVQPPAVPFVAAPAPPWAQPLAVTSPGGTVSFFPGGPVAGVVLPPVPPMPTAGFTTPQPTATHDAWGAWAAGRGASPQGQPSQQHDARGAWAAGRGASPQGQSSIPDAWAAAAAASAAAPQQSQQQPGELPRHSYTTPGGDGGKPREMRLDARGWGASQPKLDIGVYFDTFQIWKDRALMFLSRERPDVRKLLSWAETQTKEPWRMVSSLRPRTSASPTSPGLSTRSPTASK